MFAVVIGLVGVLGIAGMTWLCPALGAVWASVARHVGKGVSTKEDSSCALKKIVVAIPAHNEAQTLPRTLRGVLRASEQLRSRSEATEVRVLVGDDGSSDRTATVAAAHGVEVIAAQQSEGKWRMLRRLVHSAGEADAIVFADAGIEWPENILITLVEAARAPHVIGVAPGYRIHNGGIMSRIVWRLERTLKTFENHSGGPVSVHGATVLYRTAPLRAVFSKLSGSDFLNDDVVIPLTLRRLFPRERIVYLPEIEVADEVDARAPERRRRSRLMQGNVQWLVRGERGEALVEILAARRIFRLFWVYWITALLVPLVGVLFVVAPSLGIASLGVIVSTLLVPWKPVSVKRLVDAAVASFRAPLELFRIVRNGSTSSGGTLWR